MVQKSSNTVGICLLIIHPGSAFSIDVSRGRRSRFVPVVLPLNEGAVVPWEGARDCFALRMGGCSLLDLDKLGGN
jgi:hypothetical protein